jgi:hypothetical protein
MTASYIQPGAPPAPPPPAQSNSYIQPGTPRQPSPDPPEGRDQDDASANINRRNPTIGQQARACRQLSQTTLATSWTAARKLRAVFS